MRPNCTRLTTCGLAASLCLIGFQVHAQEKPEWRNWPLGRRAGLSVGAFFADLSTTARIDDSSGRLGTAISFERNLGLDETETRPLASAYWRFTKRQRLELFYFNLDRSGDSISNFTIRFGDRQFQANLPIETFFDAEVINLGYSFSPIFDEKKEFRIGLALSFQNLSAGLRVSETIAGIPVTISEETDVLAPLPTFTSGFAYAFTDKWILDLAVGYFTVEVDVGDKDYAGSILTLIGGIRYKAFKHFGFGLKYDWFNVNLDVTGGRVDWDLDYKYKGPMLTMSTYF